MSGGLAARRKRREDADLDRHVHGTLSAGELAALDPHTELDALGTFCPEPVIRTQDRMRGMPPDEILLLFADDGGVEIDIPAWCISTGNEYLGIIREDERYLVYVRKGVGGGVGGGAPREG